MYSLRCPMDNQRWASQQCIVYSVSLAHFQYHFFFFFSTRFWHFYRGQRMPLLHVRRSQNLFVTFQLVIAFYCHFCQRVSVSLPFFVWAAITYFVLADMFEWQGPLSIAGMLGSFHDMSCRSDELFIVNVDSTRIMEALVMCIMPSIPVHYLLQNFPGLVAHS